MKSIDIAGKLRDGIGKADVKKVRNDDKVPAVVYGIADPQHIALEYIDVERALHTPETYIVNLEVEGKKTPTIIREAQFHPVTDRIIHLDLMRIDDTKPIEVELPVELSGRCKGVLDGGQLQQLMRKIKVVGIPAALPDRFNVDITDLELGRTIKVADIESELSISTARTAGIATVIIPRAVKTGEAGVIDETEEEGAAEE